MIDYVYPKIQKKRGDSSVARSTAEALGLPNPPERATMTPRRYVNETSTHISYEKNGRYLHTHGRLSLLLFFDEYEISQVSNVQEQSA